MADPPIKSEIKSEAGVNATAGKLATLPDVDEDTSLKIPPRPHEDGPNAWLVRLPKYLWTQWADLYRNHADETPIEIGTMRVYEPSEEDPMKQRAQIHLAQGVAHHKDLPRNYELDIRTRGYSNTVVFTEKDTEDFGGGRFRNRRGGHRSSGVPLKAERYGRSGGARTGAYRTAIPKHTELAPVIHHVADAAAVRDESYYKHSAKLKAQAAEPPNRVTFRTGVDRMMHPGMSSRAPNFTTFGPSTRPHRAGTKAARREKAVRMSQEDLLDALDRCFREYRHWRLGDLRRRLQQPEVYIKQTLESIAVFVRQGDCSMTWKLKPEYAALKEISEEQQVGLVGEVKSDADEGVGVSGEEDDSGEEMDEGEFEDVGMRPG